MQPSSPNLLKRPLYKLETPLPIDFEHSLSLLVEAGLAQEFSIKSGPDHSLSAELQCASCLSPSERHQWALHEILGPALIDWSVPVHYQLSHDEAETTAEFAILGGLDEEIYLGRILFRNH